MNLANFGQTSFSIHSTIWRKYFAWTNFWSTCNFQAARQFNQEEKLFRDKIENGSKSILSIVWFASFGLFWISWKTLFFSRFECNAGGSKTFTKVYQKELQQTVWQYTNFIYHPEYWSTWVIFCFPSVLHFLSVQSFILINSNSLFIKLIF